MMGSDQEYFSEAWFFQFRCTYKRDFWPLPWKGERAGKGLVISDHKILCLEDVFARGASLFEVKLRLWFLGSQFDHVHFVQLFLAGHCHISGGNPGLVSGNEILQFADFLLLAAISRSN